MSAKKWLTILTLVTTILAVIFAVGFNHHQIKMGYDVALATFGSALLGFIMSLTEYFVERKKSMERFWQEAVSVLVKLRKVRPVDFSEPQDIILDCFSEEQSNDRILAWGKNVSSEMGLEEKHEARDNFIDWLETNELMCFTETDDCDSILKEIYEERLKGLKRQFEKSFSLFTEIASVNLSSLDNAYGYLDFLFSNKTLRADAYNKIYLPMREIRNRILAETYHFQLYAEGSGNFSVCARKLLDLESLIFEKRTNSHEGFTYECIYQTAFDNIDDALEDFRVKIYRKAKKETQEKVPVSGQLLFFDETSKQ